MTSWQIYTGRLKHDPRDGCLLQDNGEERDHLALAGAFQEFTFDEGEDAHETGVAHGRRLAACWNFCQGIDVEEMEQHDLAAYVARQAFLTGMAPTDDGMNMGLKGTAAQMLAAMFAGQFIGNGATNFLEVRFDHKETGPLLVTIQRREGKSAGQMHAEAREEAMRLTRQRAALLAAVATAAAAFEHMDNCPVGDGNCEQCRVNAGENGRLSRAAIKAALA